MGEKDAFTGIERFSTVKDDGGGKSYSIVEALGSATLDATVQALKKSLSVNVLLIPLLDVTLAPLY